MRGGKKTKNRDALSNFGLVNAELEEKLLSSKLCELKANLFFFTCVIIF